MAQTNKAPKLIFLTGIDGVGKTFFAQQLADHYRAQNHKVFQGWSRNNNYFSKFILAYTRLVGLNYKEQFDTACFQYYEFWRSSWVAAAYIQSQKYDIKIANYLNVARKIRSYDVLIFERGPYDTLIDIMLGTSRDLLTPEYLKIFLTHIPAMHHVLYVRRPLEAILKTRPELAHDKSFARRLALYEQLRTFCDWQTVENNHASDQVLKEMLLCLQ